MPTQTRDSLSRCLKELHSDAVPKDLAFLLHHGQALRPTSALGWLVRLAAPGLHLVRDQGFDCGPCRAAFY